MASVGDMPDVAWNIMSLSPSHNPLPKRIFCPQKALYGSIPEGQISIINLNT